MTVQSASSAQNQATRSDRDRQWFVATVKPQHEMAAAAALAMRGIEQFAPAYSLVRANVRADRRMVRLPLFPGYVFCYFSRAERATALKTPGVTSIVGFGGIPTPIADAEIERVRAMTDSGLPVQPWPYVERGHAVRIESGPLRGLEGVVVQVKDDYRLVVSVTLLQRSVSVNIDRDVVVPLDPQRFILQQRANSSPLGQSVQIA